MDMPATGNLQSILANLPEEDRDFLTGIFLKQQKTIALHQELIKQINQEMDLNKTVLNAAGDGIVAFDKNHTILDLNPAFAKMFGYTERELKGQNLAVLLPVPSGSGQPCDTQKPGDQGTGLLSSDNKENIIPGVHKSRGSIRVSIAISHGLRRGEKIYAGIVRDLTHQEMLERENEKQTQELKNRAKELEGLYSLAKLREEDSIPAIFRKLFTEIMPKTTRFPEKAVIVAEFDGQSYRSRDEDPVVSLTSQLHNGFLTFGFVEDIPYGTKQHQKLLDTFTGEFDKTLLQVKSGQREQQAERVSAMGELGTGIAHNVNNGLQAIQAYAQIVMDLVSAEEITGPLRKIQSKTREIGASVRGILQSSNYERNNGQFEVFDLAELIRDYLTGAENPFKSEALSHGAAITINKKFGPDTSIAGISGEITLITQALIKNSVDSFIDDGQVDIDVRREGGFVYLRVKDTGVGMSADAQKKLFEPHSMVNGSELRKGLSLNTAQKIAREHGGDIALLDSRIGQGTTMELKLPYAQHQEEQPVQVSVKTKQLNILWAEDDIIIQETVKKMAETFEDHIDFVDNGQIALDMLSKKQYDVLVTDIGMPVMGGWKLLKSIDGLYKDMPRVISSGYIVNSVDMKNSGASHLLNKPLEKPDLVKTLEHIKSNSHTSRAASVH